jgi:hypothetical protein
VLTFRCLIWSLGRFGLAARGPTPPTPIAPTNKNYKIQPRRRGGGEEGEKRGCCETWLALWGFQSRNAQDQHCLQIAQLSRYDLTSFLVYRVQTLT